MTTKVWPALKHLLIMQGDDPVQVWQLTKVKAIESLKHEEIRRLLHRFYESLIGFYPEEDNIDLALDILKYGIQFLGEAKLNRRFP